MVCAGRYFPAQTALPLARANARSSTQPLARQLFPTDVTCLHVFYTHNNQNATIRISIGNTGKKSEREDVVKMAPIAVGGHALSNDLLSKICLG